MLSNKYHRNTEHAGAGRSVEQILKGIMLSTFLAALSLTVFAQQPTDKAVAANTAQAETAAALASADRYRIGPADVLDIRVYNRPNLSRDAVRVEGNGMSRMPLIDTEMQAAC